MPRYILDCEQHEIDLARQALNYGIKEMPYKDAVIGFGPIGNLTTFYVKRTKSGLSVRVNSRPDPNT